ncbi:MAG: sigma-54-dependent Fis family transcriptional regulator [Polyangiaceae bacterium]|nr:sigma-54-dependent Fis family transcriptional regulator [Polyangiaceae bacterium]
MTGTFRVLVVDDERISRQTTVVQLTEAGYQAEAASGSEEALARLEAARWDLVLSDLRMPGADGLGLLAEIRARFPAVEVILMTAYGTVETAVQAMQHGAADYLTKPFRFAELRVRLERLLAARNARLELARLRALLDEAPPSGLIGRAAAMLHVRERIGLFASHHTPVLVTGETGTGKELVARALHAESPRESAAFVALACGAIPRELAESTLFGHERGAFTGAGQRRKGVFEQAHGGTLLFDDVDDLSLDLQVKLLRVLQEGVVQRVGAEQEVAVDVRVVATTKVDLAQAVEQGRFRSDLYYRLRGLEIHLPPLCERGDDVLLLAQHFLRVLASEAGRTAPTLGPEVAARLRAHHWPGNVRELRRALETAVALGGGSSELAPAHLPELAPASARAPRLFTLQLGGAERVSLVELVRQVEEEAIGWAMRQAHGQQTRAAELLDVPRTTLQSKLGRG